MVGAADLHVHSQYFDGRQVGVSLTGAQVAGDFFGDALGVVLRETASLRHARCAHDPSTSDFCPAVASGVCR
jgi:hypothetical protein